MDEIQIMVEDETPDSNGETITYANYFTAHVPRIGETLWIEKELEAGSRLSKLLVTNIIHMLDKKDQARYAGGHYCSIMYLTVRKIGDDDE